jgi:hypothetical protein
MRPIPGAVSQNPAATVQRTQLLQVSTVAKPQTLIYTGLYMPLHAALSLFSTDYYSSNVTGIPQNQKASIPSSCCGCALSWC